MLGRMSKDFFLNFVNIHTANNFENIVNCIIKFLRILTDFVIGNHMNTPNELKYAWKRSNFLMESYDILKTDMLLPLLTRMYKSL